MNRKVSRIVLMVVCALALAVSGLAARAKWVMGRSYADVPEPPIVADRSKEGVARGELLFHSICMECHGGADGRATGKKMDDVPSWLGDFRSANLAHPERGVRGLSDGKIARTIRTGVLPDGHLSPVMNSFGKIGDRDVAAILGYIRSGAEVFEAKGPSEIQPRTTLSLAGAMIITYVSKISVNAPSSGIEVPPKAPTVAYGRYMVAVLDCATCHTDGFSDDKMNQAGAFAGGFELTDPTGTKIYSKNITSDDESGIGRWSVDDFERAVTRGATPKGHLVRKPMPLYSRLDRTDVEALYAYLRTVPKVSRANTPGGAPLERADPNDRPEALFTKLGCVACHGESSPHRDKLMGAVGKSDDDVADWILDPSSKKPGTAMPSFKTAMDRDQALGLARYAKSLAANKATSSR